MVKLLDLKEEDFFIEFCSGFGNFTLSYLLHIINSYNNVNGNKVSGIESEDYIYLFYITTLRIIGLNLIQALNGDMLRLSSINDLIPSYNSNYKVGACMNPPFGGKDNVIAAKLVLKGCEILPKGSLFAVILPYVFAIGNSKSNGFDAAQFHRDLLKNNTLLASFSLADGTFGVAASTVVTTFIIKTGVPHFKTDENNEFILDDEGNKIPNEKTFLMYCKDDGFRILKNTRVEKKKGLGSEKVSSWLNDYQSKKIDPLKSIYIDINEEDEWLIEAYMKTDYSQLEERDFEKTIRDFYAYKIKHGGANND
jgi:RM-cspCI